MIYHKNIHKIVHKVNVMLLELNDCWYSLILDRVDLEKAQLNVRIEDIYGDTKIIMSHSGMISVHILFFLNHPHLFRKNLLALLLKSNLFLYFPSILFLVEGKLLNRFLGIGSILVVFVFYFNHDWIRIHVHNSRSISSRSNFYLNS